MNAFQSLPLVLGVITTLSAQASDKVSTVVSAVKLGAAADYSARHGGASVLVMQGGGIVFERYEPGCDAATAIHMHSSTKGFWGPVIAAMIEDKLITSFDELAGETLPEWSKDARKKTITLRHLLQLNAGLAQDIRSLQGHDRATLAPDLYAHAITLAVTTEPGQRFVYGPSCYYALGEIMKRKLSVRKQSPLDYLKARMLRPLGVEIGDWVHDEAGNPHIPNGASLTARNWSRFGQFLLQEGAWEGKQIIGEELMRELRQPSTANPGHGLAIWLNQPGGFDPQTQRSGKLPELGKGGLIYPDGDADIFAALGAGKNRLYIIPRLSLVVIRQSQRETDEFQDAEFLRLILAKGANPPAVAAASPAQRLQQLFKDADKNGDGKLSADEAGTRPFFKIADTNQDGAVTLDELRQFFRSRAPSGTAKAQ